MSKILEIELDDAGIKDLLKSPEIQRELEIYARDMGVLYEGVTEHARRAVIHGEKPRKKRKRKSTKGKGTKK